MSYVESSIVIHTLSPTNFISVDVYCCKHFERQVARDFCQRFFGPARIDEQYIERGLDYYKVDSNYHTLTVEKGGSRAPEILINKKESALAGV